MVEINLAMLGPDEQRQARYMAALARYRALAAEAAEQLSAGEAIDVSEIRHAERECMALESTPAERARPIREVSEATGIPVSTLRRWAVMGEVWAERRYGKLWYVDPDDARRIVIEHDG